MKNYFFSFLLFSIFISCNSNTGTDSKIAIAVSFSEEISTKKLDGRLLLMLSTNNEKEPRFQIGEGLNNQLIFGMNVNGLSANEKVNFNEAVFGFPIESLQNIKTGTYYIQALLNIYETFHLKTGQIVKLPMDNGEGQQWNKSPGNIYSKPVQITVTEKGIENMAIILNQIIPEIFGSFLTIESTLNVCLNSLKYLFCNIILTMSMT